MISRGDVFAQWRPVFCPTAGSLAEVQLRSGANNMSESLLVSSDISTFPFLHDRLKVPAKRSHRPSRARPLARTNCLANAHELRVADSYLHWARSTTVPSWRDLHEPCCGSAADISP